MRSRRKWLRGKDSNQRPPGYEPDELPTALPRDEMMLIDNTTRRRLCQAFFILCRTETILTRLRTILFGAFPRLRLANMYTIACVSSAKNHPKISCSEVRAVRRRRTWFVLFRSGMLPETKRICLGTIPFGAFSRPKLTGKILPPAFRHTLWEHAKRARRQKRQPIPKRVSGDGSAPPRFRFGFSFYSCCLFRGVCLAAAPEREARRFVVRRQPHHNA